ncbi:MAG: DUF948 domain-containing protein [Acidimicrobiaceae bacterium]|nr:DUF948 domain-containing protein [Acidimicrobiaceae bacterium]MYL02617.1 DUF948 domain-containing protein [Acidimicrobiaceae bacterium]
MSAVDLAAVIVTVVCLATVAVLTVAVISLVRTMRELRDVVDDLRDSALPMVDDLHATVTKADAELHRVDRVIGRAERIAATVDHASRLTHRAFAPPLIKGLSLVSGAGQAGRRLRDRRRSRRDLDLAPPGGSAPNPGASERVPVAYSPAAASRRRSEAGGSRRTRRRRR